MTPLETRRPAGLNGALSAVVKGFRIRRALRLIAPATSVLDLGCGLCEIARRVPPDTRYVGVDHDPWMVERARAAFPAFSFRQADLEDAGFEPGATFDVILLLAVWEHLHEPAALLRRARGWVGPEGRLILTTPAPRASRLLRFGSRVGLLSRLADGEHERFWTIAEIGAAAARAGWDVADSDRFLFSLNQVVVLRAVAAG